MQALKTGAFPSKAYKERGLLEISKRRVASVILAAGSGSRFGGDLPKALVSFGKKKISLLQIFCEKIAKLEEKFDLVLPTHILCSSKNILPIQQHLLENEQFGAKNIQLFTQPLITHPSGEMGPGGNGWVFKQLLAQDILSSWKRSCISSVMMIPIDNPLAQPFDLQLIGCRAKEEKDACLLAIKNEGQETSMGAILEKEGKLRILEYYENTGKEKVRPYFCSTNQFCFSLPFLEKAALFSFPYHEVLRGKGIKKEQLLFDALVLAENAGILIGDRPLCYSPLKQKTGERGIKAVEEALKNAAII